MKHNINAFYYCLYLIERYLHLAFNKINIFLFLYKIPVIKRRLKKKYGIENPLEYYNNFFLDKKNGFSLRYVFGLFFAFLLALILTLSILINRLFDLNIQFEIYYLAIFGVLSYVIHYVFIERNKVYLKYFEEFAKWNNWQKRRNIILSISLISLVVITLIKILK